MRSFINKITLRFDRNVSMFFNSVSEKNPVFFMNSKYDLSESAALVSAAGGGGGAAYSDPQNT